MAPVNGLGQLIIISYNWLDYIYNDSISKLNHFYKYRS